MVNAQKRKKDATQKKKDLNINQKQRNEERKAIFNKSERKQKEIGIDNMECSNLIKPRNLQ